MAKPLSVIGSLVAVAFVVSATAAESEIERGNLPLYSIRLLAEQTRTNVWAQTLDAFRRHPRAVDEVWFSTGVTYPSLDWHRR